MNDFDKLSDELVEKQYQLRIEHNHSDMKWYAYYAGKGSTVNLFDEDCHYNTSSDTPTGALKKLGEHILVKVRTVQIGDRLIIVNGIDPIRYVDLTKNKVVVYKPITKLFKFVYKIKGNSLCLHQSTELKEEK